MNIGKMIRELRKDAGVTQEQLAEALNVSFRAFSKWECGRAVIDALAGEEKLKQFGELREKLEKRLSELTS